MTRTPSLLSAAVLMALASAVPALAASSASSASSDSITASVGSVSTSFGKSSDSSSATTTAANGDYKIVALAAAPDRQGTLRVKLQALAEGSAEAEFTLYLPQDYTLPVVRTRTNRPAGTPPSRVEPATGAGESAVLEALLKRGENVVAVYVAPEKEGAKADPLKEAAIAAKLPVLQPATYKDPKVWEEFKALKPDLQVMAFVTLFVPEEFLNVPTRGSIQYHPSLLPAFPGVDAQRQALDYGARITVATVHFVDEGVDTGPAIVQREIPVPADRDRATLEEAIHATEHELYPEAIRMIARGGVRIDASDPRLVVIDE